MPGGKQTKFGNAVAPPLFGNVFQALPLLGIPGTDKGAGLDQTETHLTVDGQVLRSTSLDQFQFQTALRRIKTV